MTHFEIKSKRFERLQELLKEFKETGIRTGKSPIQSILDYQDIIGRSTLYESVEMYHNLDSIQRDTYLWANSCCLSSDLTIAIQREIIIREEINKIKALADKETIKAFDYLQGKVEEQKNTIDDYKRENLSLNNTLQKFYSVQREIERI